MLIRVHAAGLNVADDIMMRASRTSCACSLGPAGPNTASGGVDVAGTVTAVGNQVTDLRPGDEVFGGSAEAFAGGGFAEYASVPR